MILSIIGTDECKVHSLTYVVVVPENVVEKGATISIVVERSGTGNLAVKATTNVHGFVVDGAENRLCREILGEFSKFSSIKFAPKLFPKCEKVMQVANICDHMLQIWTTGVLMTTLALIFIGKWF